MANESQSPYICHIFVCTHDRGGEKESCADHESTAMRQILKQEIKDRGWKGRVRVSPCGCVGMCEDGPVVLMYPQKICFTEVSLDDIHQILSRIEEVLKSSSVTAKG